MSPTSDKIYQYEIEAHSQGPHLHLNSTIKTKELRVWNQASPTLKPDFVSWLWKPALFKSFGDKTKRGDEYHHGHTGQQVAVSTHHTPCLCGWKQILFHLCKPHPSESALCIYPYSLKTAPSSAPGTVSAHSGFYNYPWIIHFTRACVDYLDNLDPQEPRYVLVKQMVARIVCS